MDKLIFKWIVTKLNNGHKKNEFSHRLASSVILLIKINHRGVDG